MRREIAIRCSKRDLHLLLDLFSWQETFLEELYCPKNLQRKLRLVLEEIALNLIQHACVEYFKVKIEGEEGWVCLKIMDQGMPFDPFQMKRKEEGVREGGVGVALVLEVADTLSYETKEGWNQLCVTKRWTPKKGG